MLIFDLDDTLFPTRSMDASIFEPVIESLKRHYRLNRSESSSEAVISELWSNPIDTVFSKYETPPSVIAQFYNGLAQIDYNVLSIQPFADYQVLSKISRRKILVTTGLKELQSGKIEALGIGSDFESIHIDDPRAEPRKYKLDIFQHVLKVNNITPQEVWVIGDNPNSELKAGKQLGMNTIQRLSPSKTPSGYADFHINTFEELKAIL